MKKVVRIKLNFNSQNSYLLYESQTGLYIIIKESSKFVDGIGGLSWDGSLIMSNFLENLQVIKHDLTLVELGCGSGLCGIVFKTINTDSIVMLTDRIIDLASINSEIFTTFNNQSKRVYVAELTWGSVNGIDEQQVLQINPSGIDLIVGCEVACLRKQQEAMMSTIIRLSNPNTIILMSFDEQPQPNTCSSEREMDERLFKLGYMKETLCTGTILWSPADQNNVSETFHQEINQTFKCLLESCISLNEAIALEVSNIMEVILNKDYQNRIEIGSFVDFTNIYSNEFCSCSYKYQNCTIQSINMNKYSERLHHISVYYKSDAIQICDVCNKNRFVKLQNK